MTKIELDTFFTQDKCDRCGNGLMMRSMSWFTNECLCIYCLEEERRLKESLSDKGRSYEGCGYVPIINEANEETKKDELKEDNQKYQTHEVCNGCRKTIQENGKDDWYCQDCVGMIKKSTKQGYKEMITKKNDRELNDIFRNLYGEPSDRNLGAFERAVEAFSEAYQTAEAELLPLIELKESIITDYRSQLERAKEEIAGLRKLNDNPLKGIKP